MKTRPREVNRAWGLGLHDLREVLQIGFKDDGQVVLPVFIRVHWHLLQTREHAVVKVRQDKRIPGRRNEERTGGANFVKGHRQNFNHVKIHTREFRVSVACILLGSKSQPSQF